MSRLRDRLAFARRFAPNLLAGPAAASTAASWLGAGRARLTRIDLAAALIGCADALETVFLHLWRSLRHLRVLLRLPGLRLTTGLAWRGLAAASGIALATALVTALSAESETTLAGLTLAPEPDARPVRDVREAPRPSPAGREGWVAITKPIPIFGLQSPELDRGSARLDARRSPDGTRREDVLAFGSPAEPGAHLVLRLAVQHEPDELSRPFLIALVREAATRALSVQRSSLPAAITTRFGPVETADTTLSDGQVSRACIAFRMEAGTLPLAMTGWWCGTADKPADRQQLVCLIDRIDLLNSGDDRALRSAFARTELTRQPACAPPRLSASGRKTSWLDADGAAPALRTKSASLAQPKPRPRR